MSKTVEKILEHPIATMFIVTTILGNIADIVSAAKGKEPKPFITISVNKHKKDKKNKIRK